MVGESLIENIGDALNGSFGQYPGSAGEGKMYLETAGNEQGIDGSGVFVGEAYDSAALILLAMQASGSSMSSNLKDHVIDVANAPGERILPGELGKALQILADGGEIDYVGASDVELIGPGEAAGQYNEFEISDGMMKTIAMH